MSKTWSDYFKENMDSLGMPVPSSLYTSVTAALATIKALQAAYAAAAATEVTIADILAGTAVVELSEVIAVAGGIAASVYIAALLDSAVYASAAVGVDYLSAMNNAGVDLTGIDVTTYAQAGIAQAATDSQTATA
jgi:hypothetical protein